jgi:DNA-directed RNA polymerase sigma subunit (sigma70/sigma32)
MPSEEDKKTAEALTNYFIVQRNVDRFVMAEEQKVYLLKLAQGGDRKAMMEIMEAYKWMAEMVARIYYEYHEDTEFKKVLEKAFSALQKAVKYFDPQRGYGFSIYAFWWVVGGVGIDQSLIDLSSMKEREKKEKEQK